MTPHATRSTTTGILVLLTGLIGLAELQSEFRQATWLAYLMLAVPASRLYSRQVFRFAVGGWSLLIAAGLLPPLLAGEATADLVNRTIGLIGLWIIAYLLEQDRTFGGLRSEDEQPVLPIRSLHQISPGPFPSAEGVHEQEPNSQPPQTMLTLISPLQTEGNIRILLAEDSLETQTLMRYFFQQTPYDVEIVSDGAQAVAAFQSGRFALIFIDLQMPGTDGITATRMIRAWESAHERSPTPIVALTASTVAEAQEQSLTVGCTGFLTKPVTKAQLFDTLRKHCAPAPAPKTAPTQTGESPDVTARIDDEIQRRRPAFLDNRRKDLSRMQEALAQQDYEAIRTMGHRMKGLAGSYGFTEIGMVGQRLEQAAASRDRAAIHHEIDRLGAILAGVDQAA